MFCCLFIHFFPFLWFYLFFKTTEVCGSTTVKMLKSIMLTYIGPKKSGDDNYFISRHFHYILLRKLWNFSATCRWRFDNVQMLAFQNGFAVAMMHTHNQRRHLTQLELTALSVHFFHIMTKSKCSNKSYVKLWFNLNQ